VFVGWAEVRRWTAAWGWRDVGLGTLDSTGGPSEGGGALPDLAKAPCRRSPAVELVGLVDVRNPLTGPGGARVFCSAERSEQGG